MSKQEIYTVSNVTKTVLKLYVQPGASCSEIVGLYGEPARLKVRIKAAPQEGEANGEVISFFAKILNISKSRIEISRGHVSRKKDLLIDMNISGVIELIELRRS